MRFYAQEASRHLTSIFEDILGREPQAESGLSSDFSADAAAALDNLF